MLSSHALLLWRNRNVKKLIKELAAAVDYLADDWARYIGSEIEMGPERDLVRKAREFTTGVAVRPIVVVGET